jgi:hypothetical protein
MRINTTRHAWYLNGWILICDRYRPTGSEAIQGYLESCPTRSCRPLNSSKCSMLSIQVTVLLPFILPSTKSLDVNVNNIYVSDIDGPSPIAKLGDLGNCKCSFLHPYLLTALISIVIIEGSTKQRGQSLPCRAPEVWQGLGCQHSSDVWSLGVTVSAHTYLSQRKLIWKLARQSSPQPIFGASDKIIEGFTEAWCIAKIIRLLGPLGQPVDC